MELTLMVFCALCVALLVLAITLWRLAATTRKLNALAVEAARLKEYARHAYDNGYEKGKSVTFKNVAEKINRMGGYKTADFDVTDLRRLMGE